MSKSFVLIVISVVIGLAGQMCLKLGMNQLGTLDLSGLGAIAPTLLRMFTTPLVVVGLACYAVSAVFWLVVLSREDLSFAYPLLAMMYVLVPLASKYVLHETVPARRWIGVVIVVVGVIFVSAT